MLEEDGTNLGLKSSHSFFEQEMVNLEDLDLEIELASTLGEDNGWDATNILDNVGTPSPFNSPHACLDEHNLTTEEQQQQELESSTSETLPIHENEGPVIEGAAAPTHVRNLKGSIVATQKQVQSTEPASNQENSSNCENPVAPTLVDDPNPLPQPSPNCSAPLLNETPPALSSSSAVGLILEGAGSSIQHQDMNHMGRFNQFPRMQNENSHTLEAVGMPNQHRTRNPLLVPNIMANNSFGGINHQSSPYPAMFHTNPVEARAGIGTGHSSGQFITNQRSALQNIINPHAALISGRPEHNQFPAPNVYDSQYAPNYMQHHSSASYRPPNSFTALRRQDGHAPGMHKIYDIKSLNSMPPAYPMYPRPEPHTHLQPAFVPAPPNPVAHQHGYNRPMLPEPAVPSMPPMYSTYHHPQPSPYVTTYNSFGSGSSVQPPRYPPSYDNQNNHYNPQTTMPGGHWQQGVGTVQLLVSQGVPHQMNEYNRLLNTPNFQRQSYTLHEPTAALSSSHKGSQALSSRIVDLSATTRTTERSSSQDSNSRESDEFARLLSLIRPESASGTQVQQVTPVSASEVTNQLDKGKLPESSTTRQPSEAIRRILDMNPNRTVTRNPQQNRSLNLACGKKGVCIADPKKQLGSNGKSAVGVEGRDEQREKPRRGRPPKRREPAGESSSSSKRRKRGRPSRSPEADEITPEIENVQNEDQNANPTNPSSDSSEFFNAVYGPAFAKEGVPIDPHLRSLKASAEN